MTILDGKKLSDKIRSEVKNDVQTLQKKASLQV